MVPQLKNMVPFPDGGLVPLTRLSQFDARKTWPFEWLLTGAGGTLTVGNACIIACCIWPEASPIPTPTARIASAILALCLMVWPLLSVLLRFEGLRGVSA